MALISPSPSVPCTCDAVTAARRSGPAQPRATGGGLSIPAACRIRKGVGDAVIQRNVAGHGRDGFDPQVGRSQSQDQGQRVVDAGIRVDDDSARGGPWAPRGGRFAQNCHVSNCFFYFRRCGFRIHGILNCRSSWSLRGAFCSQNPGHSIVARSWFTLAGDLASRSCRDSCARRPQSPNGG